MDLLWTVLLLVLVGSQAQNLVDVTVKLGQNATLTCSVKDGELYWLMKVQNQFRIEIGHTITATHFFYNYPEFKSKFSMSENRLVIKNVSAEDSRLYYCGIKQNDQIVDKDTFSLLLPVPLVCPTTSIPSIISITSTPSIFRASTLPSPAAEPFIQPVLAASLGLNVLLLAAALSFLCVYIRRKGCCCCRGKDSATYNMENNDMQNPQYEEIQLPPTPVPVPVRVSSECIYYKAQHPNPKMPRY